MRYKKILIINTFGIGDVLFTLPLIANIKQQNPDVSLGFVINARTAPILNNHPLIDHIFVYERDEFQAVYKKSVKAFLKKAAYFLAEIKAVGYDAVIDLSMTTSTGLLMMIAGIPERIGFDYKGRGRFLTQKIPLKGYEQKHVVEFYGDLLKAMGFEFADKGMHFPLSSEDCQVVSDICQRYELDSCVVTIVPGGGASWGRDAQRKQWSAEKFAQLADRLVEDYGAKIILSGGCQDRELSEFVLSRMTHTAVNLTGELSLGQSAVLFSKSQLVIANDGGPLHMAVAAGAATVSIFGPVDERVYGPYPSKGHRTVCSNISCRPCYRRFRVAKCDHISCLTKLDVDCVYQAVKELLSQQTFRDECKNK